MGLFQSKTSNGPTSSYPGGQTANRSNQLYANTGFSSTETYASATSRNVKINQTSSSTTSNNLHFETLFFPDKAGLPCRRFLNNQRCTRQNCSYAHEQTSLYRFIHLLRSTKSSLDICIYNLSLNDVANEILQAHKRGIRVRVITDSQTQENQGNDIAELRSNGIICLEDKTEYCMHHKYAIIDGYLLMNGSFNWTRAAVLGNQENVIVTNAPPLVHQFKQQFEKLWKEFSPNYKH